MAPPADAPLDGAELSVRPGESVRIAPEAGEERWLEGFEVLDAQGVAVPQREEALYAFYGNGGVFALGRARLPEREPVWTAPSTPGVTVLHWLVVRDGRGGTSACRYAVDVR